MSHATIAMRTLAYWPHRFAKAEPTVCTPTKSVAADRDMEGRAERPSNQDYRCPEWWEHRNYERR